MDPWRRSAITSHSASSHAVVVSVMRADLHAPPPVKRRPQPPVMTPEREQMKATLKDPVERLGKYYQWQVEDAQRPRG